MVNAVQQLTAEYWIGAAVAMWQDPIVQWAATDSVAQLEILKCYKETYGENNLSSVSLARLCVVAALLAMRECSHTLP